MADIAAKRIGFLTLFIGAMWCWTQLWPIGVMMIYVGIKDIENGSPYFKQRKQHDR